MTQISLTELKVNPGKYVNMAQEEDIIITRNGNPVAKLVPAKPDKKAAWAKITDIFSAPELQLTEEDIKKAKEERVLE